MKSVKTFVIALALELAGVIYAIAMKRLATAALGAVLFSLVSAGDSFAQVKRVEMKIDGYLCGN